MKLCHVFKSVCVSRCMISNAMNGWTSMKHMIQHATHQFEWNTALMTRNMHGLYRFEIEPKFMQNIKWIWILKWITNTIVDLIISSARLGVFHSNVQFSIESETVLKKNKFHGSEFCFLFRWCMALDDQIWSFINYLKYCTRLSTLDTRHFSSTFPRNILHVWVRVWDDFHNWIGLMKVKPMDFPF